MAIPPLWFPQLPWVFEVICGQNWPAGDEDALRRCAQAWDDALTSVATLAGDSNETSLNTLSTVASMSADQFAKYWSQYTGTDVNDTALGQLAAQCQTMASALYGQANEVEYTKLMIDVTLVLTYIQIIIAIASAIATFGTSTAAIPFLTLIARLTVEGLVWRFIEMVAMMVLPDLIAQGWMLEVDHTATSWDTGKTGAAFENAVTGAVIGTFLGAGTGKLLGLAGEDFGRTLGGKAATLGAHVIEGGAAMDLTSVMTSGANLVAADLWGSKDQRDQAQQQWQQATSLGNLGHQFAFGGIMAAAFTAPHLGGHGNPLTFTGSDGKTYVAHLDDATLSQFKADGALPDGYKTKVFDPSGKLAGTATFNGPDVSIDKPFSQPASADLTSQPGGQGGFQITTHGGVAERWGYPADQPKAQLLTYSKPSDGTVPMPDVTGIPNAPDLVPKGSVVHYTSGDNPQVYRVDLIDPTSGTVLVAQTATPGGPLQLTGRTQFDYGPAGVGKLFDIRGATYYAHNGGTDGIPVASVNALTGKIGYSDLGTLPSGSAARLYNHAFGDHYDPLAATTAAGGHGFEPAGPGYGSGGGSGGGPGQGGPVALLGGPSSPDPAQHEAQQEPAVIESADLNAALAVQAFQHGDLVNRGDSAAPLKFTDTGEAMKYAERVWGPALDRLPPEQRAALQAYTGEAIAGSDEVSYQAVNLFLNGRIPETPQIQHAISLLDEAVRVQAVPQDVVVNRTMSLRMFRGADGQPLTDLSGLVGTTLEAAGYTSTHFGAYHEGGEEVALHLMVPEGTPAMYLGGVSHNPSEHELLLARGISYTVDAVWPEENAFGTTTWHVQAHALPAHTAGAGYTHLGAEDSAGVEHARIQSVVREDGHFRVTVASGEHTADLLVEIDHAAHRVVLGADDENGDILREIAGHVRSVPGMFDVFGHAGPDGLLVDGMRLPFSELGKLPLGIPEDASIRLFGCRAGAGNAIVELARSTGRDVIAADTDVWIDKNGNVIAARAIGPGGGAQPDLGASGTGDGTWQVIHPDGSRETLTAGDPRHPQPPTVQPAGRPGWSPDASQQELASRPPRVPPDQFWREVHATESYVVSYDDSRALYKPETGVWRGPGDTRWAGGRLYHEVWQDAHLWAEVPPGDIRFSRELAAYGTDRMLGFNLVPTTTEGAFETAGPQGTGSLQEWVPGAGSQAVGSYPPLDQQRMAVLDYVLANSDRNPGNYLTGPDGRPVAIDHGETFPVTSGEGITSQFVGAWLDKPLGPEVLDQVRAVDAEAFREMLLARGITEPAADAAVARLREIQEDGMITGRAFGGDIRSPQSWFALGAHGSQQLAGSGDSDFSRAVQADPPSTTPLDVTRAIIDRSLNEVRQLFPKQVIYLRDDTITIATYEEIISEQKDILGQPIGTGKSFGTVSEDHVRVLIETTAQAATSNRALVMGTENDDYSVVIRQGSAPDEVTRLLARVLGDLYAGRHPESPSGALRELDALSMLWNRAEVFTVQARTDDDQVAASVWADEAARLREEFRQRAEAAGIVQHEGTPPDEARARRHETWPGMSDNTRRLASRLAGDPMPAFLPGAVYFRDEFNRLDSLAYYLETYAPINEREEFFKVVLPEVMAQDFPGGFKEIYKEFLPSISREGPLPPQQEADALNRTIEIGRKVEAAYTRVVEWAEQRGIFEHNGVTADQATAIGEEEYRRAYERTTARIQKILTEISDQYKVSLDYVGSMRSGSRGPHKGGVHANLDDFDLDLFIVDRDWYDMEYPRAMTFFPDQASRGKILSDDPLVTQPDLNELNAAIAARLAEEFRINPSVVESRIALRREPPPPRHESSGPRGPAEGARRNPIADALNGTGEAANPRSQNHVR